MENLTGINIDYYITVKTSALVEIVDAVDGVEFDVPINMDYDDSSQDLHIHLKAGTQKLNGNQAEQLVRFRHNNNGTTYSSEYGDNDEGRMRTQREFIKALASQVISWNNVDKIKEIATAIFSNLETDITLSKILGYVPYAAEFNIENLSTDQLPGTPAMINDLWFYKVDSEETKELINGYIEKLGLTESEKSKYLKKSTTNTVKSNSNKNTSTNKNTTNNSKKNQTTNTTKNNTINSQNTVNENNKNTTNKNTTNKNNNVNTNNTNHNTINETNNTTNNATNNTNNNTANNTTNNITNNTTNNNQTNNEVTSGNTNSNNENKNPTIQTQITSISGARD